MLATAAVGAIFSLGALVLWGFRASWSVATGSALATINLYFLARLIEARALPGAQGAAAQKLKILIFLKMAALLFFVWGLLKLGVADPLFFVVGCASLPVGLVVGSLASDRLLPPEE